MSTFFEFDATQLPERCGFAWHPKTPHVGGCWAKKEDAQRFALYSKEPNREWFASSAKRSVPLKCVGRVGEPIDTHSGAGDGKATTVTFDYGHMMDIEFAYGDEHLPAMRFFDSNSEYQRLINAHRTEYLVDEAAADQAVEDDQREMCEALDHSFRELWPDGPPAGPSLILEAVGEAIRIKVCKPERITFHGMGSFLEDFVPDEVAVTPEARTLIKGGQEVRGLTGLNIHGGDGPISWFGYSADFLVPATDAWIQSSARDRVDEWQELTP